MGTVIAPFVQTRAIRCGLGVLVSWSWISTARAANAPEQVSRDSRYGFTVALGTGLNVTKPFGAMQIGHRFESARFFEPYVAYSYNAALSEFPFHVLGIGVRTHFASWQRVDVFHQANVGAGLSGGGSTQVPRRDVGERLLGAFVTQGVGAQLWFSGDFNAALVCETGYPVWLRSTLSVQYLF